MAVHHGLLFGSVLDAHDTDFIVLELYCVAAGISLTRLLSAITLVSTIALLTQEVAYKVCCARETRKRLVLTVLTSLQD